MIRGLELAIDQKDRFELSRLLGEIHYDLGDMPASLAAFEKALSAATVDEERCLAWIGSAQVKRVIDDLDGASADLTQAERIAEDLGLKAAEARVRFLRVCFFAGESVFPAWRH